MWIFFQLKLPGGYLNWLAQDTQREIDSKLSLSQPQGYGTQIEGLQARLVTINKLRKHVQADSCRPRIRNELMPLQNNTVVWQASCGCYRVAMLKQKGVKMACSFCPGQKCFCHTGPCRICANTERTQQSTMLKITKAMLKRFSDMWLFTEVPVTYNVKGDLHRVFYDCFIVSESGNVPDATAKADYSGCMVAVELDGSSHSNAFSKDGCKAQGQEYQDKQDQLKDKLLEENFNMKLLRYRHTMTEAQWLMALQQGVQALANHN